MIISCEKCNKKFELEDNLIPVTGRLVQCGSCSYQWHFTPENKIELVNEIKENTEVLKKKKKIKTTPINKKIKRTKIAKDKDIFKNEEQNLNNNVKKVGFINYLLVIIISIIAFIILIDTFNLQFSKFVPNLDFYLSNLYELLKDIFLFFKDLLK